MPELCRFYNIVIKMLYSDNSQHNKPHFHVYYAEFEASVGVDGELLAGSLPVKQLKLVQAGLQSTRKNYMLPGTKQSGMSPSGRLNPCGKEVQRCILWMELPMLEILLL